ncbi:DUF1540 domain-containing protein [Nitrosomonas sp. Is37]|uniref:DUF1540 domain-containing protein n=1 Tax=Nitrosomonas sp. Is37 TaxID=3080535 RepID=UPI00294AF46A|nr:DUF1540 domain-containing protein [Nitrosomonas sp. Is37]MDV6345815.1 DUF1540 domain-containing protein [Nitrosomonas sp. Is37]
MKTITIETPLVSECSVIECAYNLKRNCHARAITIGDGVHPSCDTFFINKNHTKAAMRAAGVGACKVAACKFNDDFECMTENIQVGRSTDEISCLTFAMR